MSKGNTSKPVKHYRCHGHKNVIRHFSDAGGKMEHVHWQSSLIRNTMYMFFTIHNAGFVNCSSRLGQRGNSGDFSQVFYGLVISDRNHNTLHMPEGTQVNVYTAAKQRASCFVPRSTSFVVNLGTITACLFLKQHNSFVIDHTTRCNCQTS